MKFQKALLSLIIPALAVTLALAACSTAAPETSKAVTKGKPAAAAVKNPEIPVFENDDLFLTVPSEYNSLLIVNLPNNVDAGVLFEVFEKASVEAAKAQGETDDGAGWLFSIERIDETALRRKLCADMSGEEVFAKDGKGRYYLYCHPTDVRFVRESYDDIEDDMSQWSALNEWGASVPDSFIAENKRLTPEQRGNSEIDIYLARIAYTNIKYTLSAPTGGVMEPKRMDVAPYLERLTDGATFSYADESQTPNGEYLALNFPDDGIRFDFFLADGCENYIRRVWTDGEDTGVLYKATYQGKATRAAAVMLDWRSAIQAANA